ncbi:unnamed protein product [Brassicogethes aeneus]|uniref:C2H2-type domain-containing protein n=1 Tax=Brassicogethes aeneus TaxID=1431903 RepID=A0A9P0FAM8_BRAAE|nr:unnamed protein product [Brassicogethes aeneus]
MPKSKGNNPFENKCRICLTESSVMVPLDFHFKDNSPLTLLNALEEVMSTTGAIQPLLLICRICKGLLVIAYDLKMQYIESTKTLDEYFGETTENNNNVPKVETPSKKASVEILIGDNKYDIKDLVIVEDEDKNESSYEGFLRNLGDTVSAKIVSKDYTYKPVEPESEIIIVEKETPGTIIIEEILLDDEDDMEVDKYIIRTTGTDVKQDELLQNLNIDQLILTNTIEGNFLEPNDFISNLEALKVTPAEIFKCDYCQKEYKHKGSFLHHLKTCSCLHALHGSGSTMSICPECRTPCTSKEVLIEHIKTTHNSKNLHICNVCNHVAHSNRTLSYHMLKHENKVYQCEICGKSFNRKNLLSIHKKMHSQQNSTQVLCPICGKSFHYKSGMVYHMKMHNQTRDYVCNICDKRFYMKAVLNRHVRCHTGDRPYACQYCEKKFYSKSEMLKHEMLHTGVRPHKCQFCDKGFTQKFNLELHMMSHSGPQFCEFCSKTFIDAKYLQRHVKTKHKFLVQQAQE